VQINEADLIFLNKLGSGASSIVKKALLVRQKGEHLTQPKYVAVKRISNLNDVRGSVHGLFSEYGCLLLSDACLQGCSSREGSHQKDTAYIWLSHLH
jgi:hypothetical protein